MENKSRRKNTHLKKLRGDYYYLLKIPYKTDILKDLIELHKEKNHCSVKRLIKEYHKRGFTFKGLFKSCDKILKSCIVCAQKLREYYKREPCKQMVFTKPLERVLAYILYFKLYKILKLYEKFVY